MPRSDPDDAALIRAFIAALEKLADRSTSPGDLVASEFAKEPPDEHGWSARRPLPWTTDRSSLEALYARLPGRLPPSVHGIIALGGQPMAIPLLVLEGTWEEIIARLPDLAGRRLRVLVFPVEEEGTKAPGAQVDEADTLGRLIETCQVDTGIPDLAHEHDHYLHGTPKRGS